MFSSGAAKLRNQDRHWRELTALCAHYETQPLPTSLAWYTHQLPRGWHRASALLVLVIELAVPFLIFCPAPGRAIAGVVLIVFMLLIMATGNYGFFNLLTIALCLLLFDDSVYEGLLGMQPAAWRSGAAPPWPPWVLLSVTILVFLLSLERLLRLFRLPARALQKFADWFEPLHLVNSYGLFSVMTTERLEIVVEASQDGEVWQPYEFKWKPGPIQQPPRWNQPHQPRLDWQMWFAALSDYRRNPWFEAFLGRLLQAEPSVGALLRRSPFGEAAPRYVRAVLYQYRFTNGSTRRATGAWWQRERRWLYSPVLSRQGKEERFMPPPENAS
jgi:hypothetical protein